MKKTFLFGMLLIIMAPVTGQNIIYDNPTVQTEYGVIKNYKPQIDISFDLEGGLHWFCYHDLSSMSTYGVVVPYWLNVHDFEILDDTVYFCGLDGQTGRGFWGWFDITSIFFGTGTIHYKVMPNSWQVQGSNDEEIVDMYRRINVYKIAGCTHLYMTGRGYRLSNALELESVLAEAICDASGVWSFKYTMGYDTRIGYNDVTVTDHYVVVATSIKVDSARYESGYQYYPLPTSSNPTVSIFPSSISTTNNYSIDQTIYYKQQFLADVVFSDYIIEKTDGDGFVTVCMAESPLLGYPIHVFKFFTAPLHPTSNHVSIPNPNRAKYYDIAYNSYDRSVCVVPSVYNDYVLHLIAPYNNVLQVYPVERRWFSVDDIPLTSYYTVRGSVASSTAESKIMRYSDRGNNCVSVNGIAVTGLPEYVNEEPVTQIIQEPEIQGGVLDVKADQGIIRIICR